MPMTFIDFQTYCGPFYNLRCIQISSAFGSQFITLPSMNRFW